MSNNLNSNLQVITPGRSAWGIAAGHTPGQTPPSSGASGWSRLSIPKEKMCSFPHRICRRPCFEKNNFCEIHLFLSKKAGGESSSVVCSYQAPKSGKQCWNPAITPLNSKDKNGDTPKSFCRQHRMKYIISQKKKRVHLVTSKSLIEKYSNSLKGSRSYRKKISNFAVAASSNCEQNAGGEQLPNMEGDNDERDFAHLVPFCPIGGSAGDSSEALMDYWDSDEERMDSLPISKFRPEFIENDIETRSMTTAVNEPLKHACIYSSEEVGKILCLKMKRLQQLYKQQFKFLEYDLKLSKIEFLRKMKELNKQTSDQRVTTENNAGDPSVTAKTPRQPTNTGGRNTSVNTLPSGPKMAANFATFEQRQSMKFLRSARRHKGQEMLLKQKLKEKKRIFSNIQPHSSSPLSTAHILQTKCSFFVGKGGLKCGKRTVPKSRYCLSHISSDRNQTLFAQCPIYGDDNKKCPNIVLPQFLDSSCKFHRKLIPITSSLPFDVHF